MGLVEAPSALEGLATVVASPVPAPATAPVTDMSPVPEKPWGPVTDAERLPGVGMGKSTGSGTCCASNPASEPSLSAMVVVVVKFDGEGGDVSCVAVLLQSCSPLRLSSSTVFVAAFLCSTGEVNCLLALFASKSWISRSDTVAFALARLWSSSESLRSRSFIERSTSPTISSTWSGERSSGASNLARPSSDRNPGIPKASGHRRSRPLFILSNVRSEEADKAASAVPPKFPAKSPFALKLLWLSQFWSQSAARSAPSLPTSPSRQAAW
mmetsp:Transcript_27226/g.59169  ORF Transcript_27226/g.59169 Transcript_27226/m.59169 type:complete len:269 (-) Transcript_27226:256-1062(-)